MNKYLLAIFSLILSIINVGCNKNDEPKPAQAQSALIYAVNENNLSSALKLNMRQISEAMNQLQSGSYEVYVFKTDDKESAGLYRLKSGEGQDYELVKTYTREVLSTDPIRINEVIADYLNESTGIRTLFLWGHGMAWTPFFSSHDSTRSVSGTIGSTDVPDLYSFGGDKNSSDWTDIDELRDAIPDNVFSTIWFDCCYMSNIETLYEFKGKAKKIVAYPTEIAANGLPYHHVIPFIFNDRHDLEGAAEELFKYYDLSKTAVTVAVMDMDKIDAVASACREIYLSGKNLPEENTLQNYSRSSSNPYYDLGQFAREYANKNNASDLINNLEGALNNFVIYKKASEKDFNRKEISQENYSGVSTHFFKNTISDKETYYKTLNWYKATYGSK